MIGLYDEGGLLAEELKETVLHAAKEAFCAEGRRGGADITIIGKAEMRARNCAYRGIDSVTDVLSFPAAEPGDIPGDGFWGDVLLCPERAYEQAAQYGHSNQRELAFLTVHGLLHLFGYDHEAPEDEARMACAQQRILERMGLRRDETNYT